MSTNRRGMLTAVIFGAIDVTKVVSGCLLLMTVPMSCGDHMCSQTELIFDPYAHAGHALTFSAIVINFLSLAVAGVHYAALFRRERLMIKLLEEEDGVANNRLHDILSDYPDIAARLHSAHTLSLATSIALLAATVLNVLFSGAVIFGCTFDKPGHARARWQCPHISSALTADRYGGTQSLTVFATNVALLGVGIYNGIQRSWEGVQARAAISFFVLEPQVWRGEEGALAAFATSLRFLLPPPPHHSLAVALQCH